MSRMRPGSSLESQRLSLSSPVRLGGLQRAFFSHVSHVDRDDHGDRDARACRALCLLIRSRTYHCQLHTTQHNTSPALTIHSGGANTSPSELKIPTLDFSNLPSTNLCYFTNASKEHSGTRLAINPAIIDTVFEYNEFPNSLELNLSRFLGILPSLNGWRSKRCM